MENYVNITDAVLYLYNAGFDCEHLRKIGNVGGQTVNNWLTGRRRHRSTRVYFIKNVKRNLTEIVGQLERFEREIEK